jgi:hypothetical protein
MGWPQPDPSKARKRQRAAAAGTAPMVEDRSLAGPEHTRKRPYQGFSRELGRLLIDELRDVHEGLRAVFGNRCVQVMLVAVLASAIESMGRWFDNSPPWNVAVPDMLGLCTFLALGRAAWLIVKGDW